MLISDLFIRNKLDFSEILIDVKEIFELNNSLPKNVFLSQFSHFKFNEFEWLTYDEFWEFIKTLSNITGDNSVIVSVINPDPIEYHYKQFNFFNTVTIPKNFSVEEYRNVLNFHLPDSEADAIINNSNVVSIFSNSKKWAIWADRNYGIMILGFNFDEIEVFNELNFEEWASIEDNNIITNWVSYNFENETEIKNFVDELYLNYKK